MKKIIFTVMAIALTAFTQAQVGNYNAGDVVDDFTVTDTEGNEYSLYDITASGKYVYLDFFFDTCPPCQTTTPLFNEFHDKYGCNEGALFMMSVNNGSDSDAEVIAFKEDYGGSFEHAPAISADGGAGIVDSAFGIPAYPTFCLIGPDNTLIESDIWPIADLTTFENTIPAESNAEPAECTSLNVEDVASLQFSLYPNPSNGNELNILLPETSKAQVTIYNMLGQQVFATSVETNNSLLQTSLKAGAYLVQVVSNGTTATQTLLVR